MMILVCIFPGGYCIAFHSNSYFTKLGVVIVVTVSFIFLTNLLYSQ